jgi:hypothetical protein
MAPAITAGETYIPAESRQDTLSALVTARRPSLPTARITEIEPARTAVAMIPPPNSRFTSMDELKSKLRAALGRELTHSELEQYIDQFNYSVMV